jgi:hypothetical protein
MGKDEEKENTLTQSTVLLGLTYPRGSAYDSPAIFGSVIVKV